MTRKIEYRGQVLETVYDGTISDEKYKELVDEYYKKPDFALVKKQLQNISNGGVMNNHITNYYFKDLMAKTKVYFNKWSIEDVLEYKPLLECMFDKTRFNKKIYPDSMSDIKKLETSFRLGGKGVASKVSQFPIKTVDYILDNYNINGNYYDFSCGWGIRLLSALRHNINYYGTDPNYLLVDRLKQMSKDYKVVNGGDSIVDIRAVGSENYQQDWVGKIGVAFTSPPYFNLEDYKVGEQSCKINSNYQDWLENYLSPTIDNIYGYLVDDGILAININNFDKYDLVGDTIKICQRNGFVFVEEFTLKNIKRCNSKASFNDNSEKVMIFKKSNTI